MRQKIKSAIGWWVSRRERAQCWCRIRFPRARIRHWRAPCEWVYQVSGSEVMCCYMRVFLLVPCSAWTEKSTVLLVEFFGICIDFRLLIDKLRVSRCLTSSCVVLTLQPWPTLPWPWMCGSMHAWGLCICHPGPCRTYRVPGVRAVWLLSHRVRRRVERSRIVPGLISGHDVVCCGSRDI